MNDNLTDYVEPTENDQLSWGVDWIDAERVWGGAEDATNVVTGNYAGENIKIGIIDTGIDYNHPDLNDNYVTGIDFGDDDSDPMDSGSHEHVGHGTHVAGIIGAEDNNVLGVIGVAPKVSLYGIKVVSDSGSLSTSNIIAGIDWATDNQLDIINLSLSAPFGTTALEEAINRAWDAGIVVVAGAGNREWVGPIYCWWVGAPAKYDKSIAVANLEPEPSSTNPTSVTRNSASCTGSSLDVSAPGTTIMSTYPSNTYYEASGTSMASPMVAGTCALILSANPWFTPDDVRDILIETVGDLGDTGHDNKYGYGQINAWSAVEEANITDPTDTDNDGLYDMEELQLGTDPFDSDTDCDLLSDGAEVNIYGTDPLMHDTDGDTMIDSWEITYSFNPLVAGDKYGDPDGDGLVNYKEHIAGSNPYDTDTDNDGLTDYEEFELYYTDLLNIDTDGDGYTDYYELFPPFPYNPSNPNDYNSIPTVGVPGGPGFFP
ncbi:MAG: S8 family serine peptidase [Candidatus Heimdallarchaeaceae archaeon]